MLAALAALKAQGVTDLRRHFAEHPGFLRQAAGMVKVLDVNQAALRMSGIPNKRSVLGTLDRLFDRQSLDLLREELVAIFEGKTFFEAESSNRTPQGERLDTQVSLAIPSEQVAPFATFSCVPWTSPSASAPRKSAPRSRCACAKPDASRAWACWRAASPTTSTICSP